MLKRLGEFLAWWAGLTVVLTVLSLWMSGFVVVHYVVGLSFIGAICFIAIDRRIGRKTAKWDGAMGDKWSSGAALLLFLLYGFGLYQIISDDHRYTTKDVVIGAAVFPYPWWVGGKTIYRI